MSKMVNIYDRTKDCSLNHLYNAYTHLWHSRGIKSNNNNCEMYLVQNHAHLGTCTYKDS